MLLSFVVMLSSRCMGNISIFLSGLWMWANSAMAAIDINRLFCDMGCFPIIWANVVWSIIRGGCSITAFGVTMGPSNIADVTWGRNRSACSVGVPSVADWTVFIAFCRIADLRKVIL